VPRKTIIFGNGLGMALDPEFFSLDSAIGRTWGGDVLSEEQKRLVSQCLPPDAYDRPHGEADMDTLHKALSACDVLNSVGEGRIHWLTPQGQGFPRAVRRFFYYIARGFHRYSDGLPDPFIDALAGFLEETNSHVATLNYDNLIYQPLIEREVLRGYDGALCDGFHDSGCAPDNLERRYNHDFGYYLHLHGSPLFIDRDRATIKLAQGDEPSSGDVVGSHIVLTHVRHKASVIDASEVLFIYWRYFVQAIGESEEVILLGYSGLDVHLNAILQSSPQHVRFRVVEWNCVGEEAVRVQFWRQRLGREDTVLVRLPSILNFDGWNAA